MGLTYAEIVESIRQTSTMVHEFAGPAHVAVVPDGGRIAAIAFSPDEDSVLWSDPRIGQLTGPPSRTLRYGPGGDRLWLGPETRFFWSGPPDWLNGTNYRVPASVDPGEYDVLDAAPDRIVIRTGIQLEPTDGSAAILGDLTRSLEMSPAPAVLGSDTVSVGLELTNTLRIDEQSRARGIDLWRLLQVEPGAVLIVPIAPTSADLAQAGSDLAPLVYTGSPGGWIREVDHLLWSYTGRAGTKQSLSARLLTGRCGVLRQTDENEYILIIRECPVDPEAHYVDHPHGVPCSDQAFQIWDGHGFGEVEYRSRVLGDSDNGILSEVDHLWVFRGDRSAVDAVAVELLGNSLGTRLDLTTAFDLARLRGDVR